MTRGIRRGLGILLAVGAGAPLPAQTVTTSAGPERVAVTVYRNPDRSADDAIDLGWLQGYALVTETRRLTIPAGTATIRFEGVAAGALPESAIVTGLPAGVSEKNLDADLLSPRSLYDRSLGRPVTIRRTYPDGRVIEEAAVIRSAAEGAMVVQTRAGVEALQCSGLPEAIVYPDIPPGLSAKPTLSVETSSPRAAEAVVTLSYLAWGFDWQANYVVDLGSDGRTARLFAWVTLANGDDTGFANAATAVVAGKLNRESDASDMPERPDPELYVECQQEEAPAPPPPAPPPPPPVMMAAPAMRMEAMDVVVTGSRLVRQEELGDLKLYRVPFPTTVAARAQKQVAMLDRTGVPVRIVHVSEVYGGDVNDTTIELRTRNRREDGLGVPLPAGPVAVFRPGAGKRLLAGEGSLDDKAVGEDVEIAIATPTQVDADAEEDENGRVTLTVTNANPWPVAYEAKIGAEDGGRITGASARLLREDGRNVWKTTVPANGSATLRYRLVKSKN